MKIRSDFLNTTPPAAQPAQGTGSGLANAMSNFASLLQQQSRAPALPPVAPSPVATPPKAAATTSEVTTTDSSANESTEAADETAADGAAKQPRPANKPRARQTDAQAPARAREENTPARSDKKSAVADEDSSATPADPKAQSDSATPAWLAGWMAPPATTVPPASTVGAQRSTGLAEVADGSDTLPGDADAATGAVGTSRGRGMLPGGRKDDAGDTLAAAGTGRSAEGNAQAASKEAAALPGFAAVLAEQRQADPARRSDAAMPSVDAAAGASASGAPTGGVSHDARSTGDAQVHAAVGSPEFPQELGVQLSVLARDGIQQAELHLNPTEMGPVSVQIVMDGTQARIDFGADVAATRHAIEAGLPELASALRDAGFTLAGGGVSQHAGGRQGSDGDGARRDGSASRGAAKAIDGGDSTSRVVRTRVSAGGVDLYA